MSDAFKTITAVPARKAPERMDEKTAPFRTIGEEIGAFTDEKNRQYGNSAGKTEAILKSLYPEGIPTFAYTDALLIVRILDKLSRLAQRGVEGKDLGGESPYRDLVGYGLIGVKKDEGNDL